MQFSHVAGVFDYATLNSVQSDEYKVGAGWPQQHKQNI